MQHLLQREALPIRLIRGMSAMLMEVKDYITSSLTDISIIILSAIR